jgi:uncharacterized protein YndB with AHSA1/START domain
MGKPNFVYVTYIASTPEKVFKALTDTDATARFWFGNAVASDWKVGSPVTFRRNGELVISGKVLEFDPPRRLSYTFLSQKDGLHTEQPSRVLIEIEHQKGQVKLTMTHDDFPAGSKTFDKISNGWPLVLSSLKSYLEADRVLSAPWCDKETAAA